MNSPHPPARHPRPALTLQLEKREAQNLYTGCRVGRGVGCVCVCVCVCVAKGGEVEGCVYVCVGGVCVVWCGCVAEGGEVEGCVCICVLG